MKTLAAGLLAASLPLGPSRWQNDSGRLEADDGIELFYVHFGSGPETVILPNALYLSRDFRWLTRRYRVISYDLRNRGRSEAVSDAGRLEGGIHRDVADLEAVRRHFNVDRFHLVGHSYLGLMAALYATEHPSRVERLVLIGAIGPEPTRVYEAPFQNRDATLVEQQKALAEWRERAGAQPESREICESWWRLMARILVGDPAVADEVWHPDYCEHPNEYPTRVEEYLAHHIWPTILELELTREDFDEVTAEALVIHGTADRNAPYGGGRDWASALPRARLLAVNRAGHLPWLEESEVVFDAIREFLAGSWPAASRRP